MNTLDTIRQERINKVTSLRKSGTNPYPTFFCKNILISSARNSLDKNVIVAGRIISLRGHGKLIFADLKDESARIQLMLKADILKKDFEAISSLDAGDFLLVEGKVTKTISGEISILVEKFQLLTKSIRPLPEKWHGLKDVEERYRQRYVDLLVNDNVKEIFLIRNKVVKFLRKFLDDNGFTEVETPVLQQIYGGASAKPFVTHHNALDNDFYLRISDELYLKRLVVGGFEKVYELSKDFRNEGMSRAHNPEFTQVEFYWAYVDYERLMDFTEEMLTTLIKEINGNLKIKYKDKEYNFKTPWKRISYRDLFLENLQIDIDIINNEEKLAAIIAEKKLLPNEKIVGYGQTLDILYKKYIRPQLDGPLFLTDHPVEMKPLAKRKNNDPTKAASFQLLVAGEEWLNAYNELNDPADQKARWEEEMELGKKGAEDYQVIDDDYIRALEYGMPPTAGWGLGVDRLVAFLTNQPTLKDVILFPTLRPENKINTNNVCRDAKSCVSTDLTITRETALQIINQNISNKNLIKHALAVEAAMKALAKHFKQDENLWSMVGLLHDADWEKTKDDYQAHGKTTVEWLKKTGENNSQLLNAILSHNFTNNGAGEPQSQLDWSIYCCDELTGFIIAVALILPNKKLNDVTIEAVIKKFPSKSFAAGVKREQIKMCEEKLGIKLEEFIKIVLTSMQEIAPTLGL